MAKKSNSTLIFVFALLLELVGVAAIGGGIGVELIMEAHFGFISISVGSVFVAIGGIIWGKFMRRT
ncbi:hypothetical protein ES703_91929 [subsurface metagenome]